MKSKTKALTPEEKLSQALLPREEWPYELPKGWVWTRMVYISSRIKRGRTPKYADEGSVLVFAQKCNQKDGTINLDKAQFLRTENIAKYNDEEYLHDLDTVVNSTGTGTLGRVGLYRQEDNHTGCRIVPDTHVTIVRTIQPINALYFNLFMKSLKDFLEKQGVGSTNQKELRPETIGQIDFPLPPLPEQQRIVDKIESLFSKLDEAGDRLQKVLDGYEARRAAILHEAFSGKWTGDHGAGDMSVPKGWRKAAIKDLCHRLSYGTSKKSLAEGKYIVIRMGNLQNGTIDWSNLAYSNDETEYAKYKLNPGDVLFNRTNSSELVGKTSIYKGEYPAIYAGYLIKLDYDRALINGEYLNYYLNSPRAKLYYNQVKTDGVNQSNINSKKIGNFEIAFPSMEEQNNIVSKLNHIFENDKKSLFLAKKSLSKIDLLKKSILARAFRGELGTQDPSDPSALELLKECVLAGKEVSKS